MSYTNNVLYKDQSHSYNCHGSASLSHTSKALFFLILGFRIFFQNIKVGGGKNQRTNGPVNAHLISWPGKAQNIENLENIL